MASEFRKWLYNIYSDVWKQTEEQDDLDKHNWIEYYNNWVDIVPALSRDASNIASYSSDILGCFLLELQRSILWCMTCVFSGAYHSSIRELRFLLEATARCRYIDEEYSTCSQEERLAHFKESFPPDKPPQRAYSFKHLIQDDNYWEEILTTWKELNAFVHCSFKALCWDVEDDEFIADPRVSFVFDEKEFQEAVRLSNATMDAIFYLILKRYSFFLPKIRKIDEQREEKARIIQSFEEMNHKLCLRICHSE